MLFAKAAGNSCCRPVYFYKKGPGNHDDYPGLLGESLFSCCNYFFAIIVAAFRAYMMGHLRFVALRAGYKTGSLQFPISTTLVTAGLGHFSLWYCHCWFTSGTIRLTV
jgi:hypothetical protein